jgi:hypothetical protein
VVEKSSNRFFNPKNLVLPYFNLKNTLRTPRTKLFFCLKLDPYFSSKIKGKKYLNETLLVK